MKKNVLIIVLTVLLLGVSGYLIYDKVMNNNVENNEIINNNDNNNETINNNQNNSYKLFVDNFKNNYLKFDSNNYISQFVVSEFLSSDYKVYMDENKNLYIKYSDKNLNDKYGNYLIANNVLYFNIISTGQGGGNTLFFINQDGTVGSASIEYNVSGDDSKIEVKKDLGYKNIISVVSGRFGDNYTGVSDAIFIDINGNIYSYNLK